MPVLSEPHCGSAANRFYLMHDMPVVSDTYCCSAAKKVCHAASFEVGNASIAKNCVMPAPLEIGEGGIGKARQRYYKQVVTIL